MAKRRTVVSEGPPVAPTGRRTLTDADCTAIAEAFTAAVRGGGALPKVPAPVRPSDAAGDRGDAHRDRADLLLGSFGKWPATTYALSDLQDPKTMDLVFSGRAYTGSAAPSVSRDPGVA